MAFDEKAMGSLGRLYNIQRRRDLVIIMFSKIVSGLTTSPLIG